MPFALIEHFAELAARTTRAADLFAHTEAAARELGFPLLALVHGLAFRLPQHGLIDLNNFGSWEETFVRRKYYLDDPALLAAQRTNTAFAWSAIRKLVPLGDRHRHILEDAARHGLGNGYTLPVGVIGEPHGCCTFATKGPDLPPVANRRAAALLGAEAFNAARRLHGFPARSAAVPLLSRRKLECLRYVAIGKTDAEIAIILGLKESTVRTYMAMLRKDFDVVSRSQLVAAALRFGFIGYDDAIAP
ncbi:LuxR family transcriptional regulator [Sphingomonas sp.]|uniref:helix-turn-helix transcriptional regulator n=1 Tax=Sphingomonas sp. TaxID=28214 RepID=UPI0025F3EC18|nr:LuxR family transcriptional regulator [Sphingomonas sp.]